MLRLMLMSGEITLLGTHDENDKLARHDPTRGLRWARNVSSACSGQGGPEDKLDRQQQASSSGVVNRTNCPVQPTSLIMNTYTCINKPTS